MKKHISKQNTIWLYNYGIITKIASFCYNGHDCYKCMKLLNNDLLRAHTHLPEKIFYYTSYIQNGKTRFFVDYENALIQDIDKRSELMSSKENLLYC